MRGETVQRIAQEPRDFGEPVTVRGLSRSAHGSIKELVPHLFRRQPSVKGAGEVWKRFPSTGRGCGLEFSKGRDFERPSEVRKVVGNGSLLLVPDDLFLDTTSVHPPGSHHCPPRPADRRGVLEAGRSNIGISRNGDGLPCEVGTGAPWMPKGEETRKGLFI